MSEKIGQVPPANSLSEIFTPLPFFARSGFRQRFPPPYLKKPDTPDTKLNFALQINKLDPVFLCQTFFSLTQSLCQAQTRLWAAPSRVGRGLQAEGTGLVGTGFASNWSRGGAARPLRALCATLRCRATYPRDKKKPRLATGLTGSTLCRLVYCTATGAVATGLSTFAAFAGLRGAVSIAARASRITLRMKSIT